MKTIFSPYYVLCFQASHMPFLSTNRNALCCFTFSLFTFPLSNIKDFLIFVFINRRINFQLERYIFIIISVVRVLSKNHKFFKTVQKYVWLSFSFIIFIKCKIFRHWLLCCICEKHTFSFNVLNTIWNPIFCVFKLDVASLPDTLLFLCLYILKYV